MMQTMPKRTQFLLSDNTAALEQVLTEDFEPLFADTVERVFLDTFDSRMLNAGLLVFLDYRDDGVLLNVRSREGEDRLLLPFDAAIPLRPDKLKAAPARRLLGSACQGRTLLEQQRCSFRLSQFVTQDKEQKQTGVIELLQSENHSTSASPLSVLSAVPKRGYSSEFEQQFVPWLKRHNFQRSKEDPVFSAFSKYIRETDEYLAKPRYQMSGGELPAVALAHYSAACFELAQKNLAGIVADIDSEFLHDYRIHMRRIRSLLSSFKTYAGELKLLHQDFRWLSALSGEARDLDVWLEDFDATDQNPGEFETLLKARRQAAYRELITALKSKRYKQFCRNFRQWQRRCLHNAQSAADDNLNKVLPKLIRRRHARLARAISKHQQHMPVDTLHDIRKSAKQLRYLMEAAVPGKSATYSAALKRVKAVQKEVGLVCDQWARTEHLQRWLTQTEDPNELAVIECYCARNFTPLPQMLKLSKKRHQTLRQCLLRLCEDKTMKLFANLKPGITATMA